MLSGKTVVMVVIYTSQYVHKGLLPLLSFHYTCMCHRELASYDVTCHYEWEFNLYAVHHHVSLYYIMTPKI